ncbi:extracellular solute-binding protein [Streptomyces hygroscopicus subsp. hygroscopicus]|uniref:extracellular solute-binding protein n=1 Tax=Streptomyces hygroscopicus TaxID=1912 RepID=UPI001C65B0C6|nr:extracellular solute-binding protein [Streptomyces hygroscopicus]MBW8091311.1 extracellular solute-binding protein [Streptomyces hygroscopicus subsp. hygroscopicus]
MRIPRSRSTLRASTLAAAVLLVGTALAGCGSGGPGGSDDDSLDVWVYQDASTKVQREVVKRFNKTSDVKVKLTQVPGDGYSDKMRTSMGTPNAPDVFFNWGGGSISDFVKKGMLLDLDPAMAEDPELKKAFIPTILDAGAIDGKHYGIPMRGMQPVILFYNKNVFADAGAKPPKSWDDLLKLIDTFKSAGVTPFALAGTDAWTEQMWVEYLVDRYGGAGVFQKVRSRGMAAWDDPAVLKTARTIRDLVGRGAFGKNYKSVNYTADGASTLFAKGKAAMHLMGSWEYANQKANQPAFAKSGLGWTTFPAVPGGSGDPKSVVGNPTNYWSVNAKVKGEKRKAALEFVKFAAGQDYSKDLIANGDIPATSDAASLLGGHENPGYARFQYQLVERAPDFTLSWDQALPAKYTPPLYTAIQKLFNGQLDPDGFVDALKGM